MRKWNLKVFTGDSPAEIEETVNKWFNNQPENMAVYNISLNHCPGVYEPPNTIGYSFSMAITFGEAV